MQQGIGKGVKKIQLVSVFYLKSMSGNFPSYKGQHKLWHKPVNGFVKLRFVGNREALKVSKAHKF